MPASVPPKLQGAPREIQGEFPHGDDVQADEAVDAFTGAVQKAMKKRDDITLVGFGTFKVARWKARTGVNPQTKEHAGNGKPDACDLEVDSSISTIRSSVITFTSPETRLDWGARSWWTTRSTSVHPGAAAIRMISRLRG